MSTFTETCLACGSIFTAQTDVSSFLAMSAAWNDTHDCATPDQRKATP